MSYWRSESGARHRRRDRQRRTLIAHVDQEPVRKGKRAAASGSEFRTAMQAALADQANWPRRRASLAVDLHFTTSRRQPPNLENLAKHYLDQLSETHDQGESGHLYRDDRQIQLLYVSAHHGWDTHGPRFEPGVFVIARTASEAAAEMSEAARLPLSGDGHDVDDLEWNEISEQHRDAKNLSTSTFPELRRAAPLMRFLALRRAQESILHANDRWIQHLCWGVPYLLSGREAAPDTRSSLLGACLREVVFERHPLGRSTQFGRDPCTIVLPPLPAAPGEGEPFRRGVRDAVRSYVDADTALFPLLVPIRLTVIVIQPEVSRDLDNILLDLLPVVDEMMKPPRIPWLLSAVDSLDDIRSEDPLAEWKSGGLRRLPSVMEHGVWSCQVIELKRLASDPPEGALRIILGHGENSRSLWEEAFARLESSDECGHTD